MNIPQTDPAAPDLPDDDDIRVIVLPPKIAELMARPPLPELPRRQRSLFPQRGGSRNSSRIDPHAIVTFGTVGD